jgi:hypothetical protein
MIDNSDDNNVYTVNRTPKPWIVLENNGAARSPGIYHFDSREEAEAFAKAEQVSWDEEYREWCRREAEYERRNSEPGQRVFSHLQSLGNSC